MLQEIRILLVEAEEAIRRLISVKAMIAAEVARQVAEAPGKTLVAKKQKVLSGLGQEERKTITDLDQHFRRRSLGSLKNINQRRRHQNQTQKQRSPNTKHLY